MKTNIFIRILVSIAFCFGGALFTQIGAANASQDAVGGVTFSGPRNGHCVQITGNDIEEIYFELDTCDEMGQEKSTYSNKIYFTLFVPEGTHKFKLLKNGEMILMKAITVKREEVLTIKLPEGVEE